MGNRRKAICLAIAEATIDQAIAEHEANRLAAAIAKHATPGASRQPSTFQQHLAAALLGEGKPPS
jgi:hypothetical protein